MKTLFEKIIDREIPATFVYEDDLVVAFRDIAPVAPMHILIVPRKPIQMLSDVETEDEAILGRMLHVAKIIAAQEGLENGYRTTINCGADGGQEVYHLHLHLMGGRKMKSLA